MIYASELILLLFVYSASSSLLVLVLQIVELKFRRRKEILSLRAVGSYLITVLFGIVGGALLWKFVPSFGPVFLNPYKIGVPFFFPAAFIAASLGAIIGSFLLAERKRFLED